MERSSTTRLLIPLIVAAALAAEAGWAAATTSGTPDETTYLAAGNAFYQRGDAAPLADDGIAPLPVLINTALPIAVGASGNYARAIRLARVSAILLVGVPLVLIAYGWLLRTCGPTAAAAGSALVAISPNIVGHAAVAATDICFVAAALLALLALARYIDRRSAARLAWVAIAFGVALGAKYSAVALLPALFAVLAATDGDRPWASRIARAGWATIGIAASALVIVWTLHGLAMVAPKTPAAGARRMPAVIAGIVSQAIHQRGGHPSFLLGRTSATGWWYYMPAALAMKSTPAELAVFTIAIGALVFGRRRLSPDALVWRAAIVSFGAFALVNRLDLGVRYVLLVVPLLVFIAFDWLRRTVSPSMLAIASAVLVASQIASAVSIGPHSLSYFNRLSGGPENGYRLLADSNVDWGQDLPALGAEVARLGGGPLLFSYFGNAPFEAYGVSAKKWDTNDQRDFDQFRWVAISATHLDGLFVPDDVFAPFRSVAPSGRAAYSILIYATDRTDVRAAFDDVARRWRAVRD